MDLTSLTVVLWQVCLIEALVCLILLVGVIFATNRWRMAIRRAIAGVRRGEMAQTDRGVKPETRREIKITNDIEVMTEAMRGAIPEADKGPGALKSFSSIIANSATQLKRSISAIPEIFSNKASSLEKPREKLTDESESVSSNMAEYALHLRSHAVALKSLTEASRELKDEVSRQHRILNELTTAVNKSLDSTKPGTTGAPVSQPEAIDERLSLIKEAPIARPKEVNQISGRFRYQRQPDKERGVAVEDAVSKKPSLATRHTLATKEAIARKENQITGP